jgi:hypothetical protein
LSHYLYLTNSTLVSLVAGRGAFVSRRDFPATEEGLTRFESYLAPLARIPVHLFTDLAEEDFRTDTIPHVGRGDRAAILARKLGQVFRNAPYRHALVQGRESEGRRDDRVVYTAITSAELVKPWLDALDRREVPLEGIHSAALLGGRLLEALGVNHPHTLLVHFSPGEMLRQTYFRGRELRLARITHVDLQEGQSLGALLAEETSRTWQYLDNLRSFGADGRLEVVILAHLRDHPMIRPALEGFQRLAYHLIDTDQVAARIGLKPPPVSSTAEELLVHLFSRKPIENHFATAEMRRHATLHAARGKLVTAAAGVLLGGIVMSGFTLVNAMQTASGDERNAREVVELNRQYDQISRAMPSFEVGGAAMRDAVTFYSGYIQGFPTVGSFVLPLSAALEKHPAVQLNQLAWQVTDDPKSTPVMKPQLSRVPPPVKAAARGAELAARTPATDEAAPVTFAGGRFEVALLEALVSAPSQDFRRALAEVEALVADIDAVKGYQAQIFESPLDVRPSLEIHGRNAERDPGSMEARFMLRIVRTREPNA